MIFAADLLESAAVVIDICRRKGLRLATAESCTGGLISALVTTVAGSSDVFDAGFVTYSNAAKTQMIGVPESLIAAHGAVSEEVAVAMAEGALDRSHAGITVAVTGIAGPGGGSAAKPVGLVHLAVARRGARPLRHALRLGDIGREPIRLATVAAALAMLQDVVASDP
ncbi:MAG: CinA family protein [Alphaproteobacteria bacterium]|nr:CinA family protein [Alphaproteobacteria bacterium]